MPEADDAQATAADPSEENPQEQAAQPADKADTAPAADEPVTTKENGTTSDETAQQIIDADHDLPPPPAPTANSPELSTPPPAPAASEPVNNAEDLPPPPLEASSPEPDAELGQIVLVSNPTVDGSSNSAPPGAASPPKPTAKPQMLRQRSSMSIGMAPAVSDVADYGLVR